MQVALRAPPPLPSLLLLLLLLLFQHVWHSRRQQHLQCRPHPVQHHLVLLLQQLMWLQAAIAHSRTSCLPGPARTATPPQRVQEVTLGVRSRPTPQQRQQQDRQTRGPSTTRQSSANGEVRAEPAREGGANAALTRVKWVTTVLFVCGKSKACEPYLVSALLPVRTCCLALACSTCQPGMRKLH